MNDSTFIVFRSTLLLGHSRHRQRLRDSLDKLAMNVDGIAESATAFEAPAFEARIDDDYEHRSAEHEQES